MNTPDPRHAAATAPATSPQAPQWAGQTPSVIDPAMIAHLANALFNSSPGQTPDPQALADFGVRQERPPQPPSSLPGAMGAAAAVPGTSVPGKVVNETDGGSYAALQALPKSMGSFTGLVRDDAPRDFSTGLQQAAGPAQALYFVKDASTHEMPREPSSIAPLQNLPQTFPDVAPEHMKAGQPSAHDAPVAGHTGRQFQQTPTYGRNFPAETELRPQEMSALQGLPPPTFPHGYSADSNPSERPYFLGEPGSHPHAPAPAATPTARPVSADHSLYTYGRPLFDPTSIKKDFPILDQKVHGKRLVWLDNAATTQKPKAVIDRLSAFYENENSNIHRGAHVLAARSTDAYEAAREKVRRFLGAGSPNEIVFTRGATEAINLVAQAWGRRNIRAGDEIVVTWLEHHANIVPWQMLCAETGAHLRVAPVDDSGQILLDEYTKLLGPKTRLVTLPQVSNALGTITPAAEMVAIAHRHGACVLVDGAQAVSHMPVDVQALDCDFYVFSGHKVFAPTGIGVLYGKPEVLAHMPPWQGGGNMIADVTFEKTTYQPAPGRFEAGTGNIADAVGLGAAIDYVENIGMGIIEAYEHGLLAYMTEGLCKVPGLSIIGTANEKAGVVSFVLDGCRVTDVGKALDREGIAVRAGHHCAQPILRRFGLEATVRPSLAFYNTCEDIDALVAALLRIQRQKARA